LVHSLLMHGAHPLEDKDRHARRVIFCPGCARVFWREDAVSRNRREQNIDDPATAWILGFIARSGDAGLRLFARGAVRFETWRTAHVRKGAQPGPQASSVISPRDDRHSA
jgi:hypothetical protein